MQILTRQTEIILFFAFSSFLVFAIVEMIFAYSTNSLSLLGDAAAMIVDAFTYVVNFYALRRARRGTSDRVLHTAPLVSSAMLVAVMVYVLVGASQALAEPGAADVTVQTVLIFGCANLLLDGLNLYLFAAFPDAFMAILTFTDPESIQADGGLNVRSALTHIISDTWRSVAVVVASVVAILFEGHISSSNCDAVGAIVVQGPILGMCGYMAWTVLKRLRGQNGAEAADVEMQIESFFEKTPIKDAPILALAVPPALEPPEVDV